MRAIDKKLKKCKTCEEVKSTTLFYKQSQRGNNLVWEYYDSICKVCRLDYSYNRRKLLKKQCVEYKGSCCLDCGIKDDILDIYDFHHLDPLEKDFDISGISKSFEKIKSELDKCVLLCSNCHRKRHSKN